MTHSVPAAPLFGEAAPIEATPEVLSFLARRRSASALALTEPAPSDEDLAILLRLATRVPDHGKLAPWRFVILRGDGKRRFIAGLEAIAERRSDAAKLQAKLGKLKAPPLSVAVISRLTPGDIPEWEQRLSAGALCMTLVIAAQAMGYGANWITDWYAYDEDATRLLGLQGGERVAGYVHVGASTEPPLERVRPDVAATGQRVGRASGVGARFSLPPAPRREARIWRPAPAMSAGVSAPITACAA